MAAAAIGPDEARRLLAPLRAADRVLLAVSGGPDSTALLHFAASLASTEPWPPMEAASVNHGLQAGSAAVAATAVAAARAVGLPAHLLTWDGPKPRTGIQAAARQARYGLLDSLARQLGASHLVTAHTLDDQAETILFRMARGSGPAGLAGMRQSAERGGLVHLRPLLGIAKTRLLATCRERGWSFVDDAANRDPRYARARIRTLLPRLATEGLDAATLARLGERLALSQAAITSAARALHQRAARPAAPGRVVFDAAELFAAPRAVGLAVLNEALTDFNHPGPPRLERLEALANELNGELQAGRAIGRTLHGSLVKLTRDACLVLTREPPRHRGSPRPVKGNNHGPV